MRREGLIINGKKLNFIQRWLFERDDKKIRNYIKGFDICLMFVFAFVVISWYSQEDSLYIWAIVVLEFVTLRYYDKFIDNVVYMFTGDEYGILPEDIDTPIKKSWVMTSEKIQNVYKRDIRGLEDQRVKIIMNSSGHKVIEEIKQNVIDQLPILVSDVDSITDPMMKSVMKHYRNTNEEIKVDSKKYDFSKKPMDVLRNLYALSNGIILENGFSKRALEIKPKEELLQFLNEKFTIKDQ